MRPLAVLRHDVPASLVVFLVAVPLSLGIALASGAPIVAGLIAAIVGGVVAGALGGSPLQVSGPAAGLTVIMAETISTFGWAVTCLITVAAGALQVLLGLSRIARAALAISPAIVHGMLAGIGVTIVLGQLHVILGGKAQSSAVENIAELPAQIVAHHDAAAVIGLLTIAVLVLWPRLPAAVRKVPGPLAAIALATAVSVAAGMTLPRVELPGDLLQIRFAPELPGGGWADVAVAAVTIALIASVESLLSAVAVDKLHNGARSRLDRELVGQGAANMVSGTLGGLPVTGVIVRSSTNVAAGAKTRASAILHGVWVLVFVVLLAGLIQNIPLAALAGLLVHVGAKLVNPGHLKQVLRHGDLALYLVTLAGVVVFDLLTGVIAGIVLALLLMLRRTVWSGIHVERDGEQWRVVVEGVLTFLSVPRLTKVLGTVPEGATVTLELVVDYLDHASFESLVGWQQAHERAGGTVTVDEIGHPWLAKGRAGNPTLRRTGAAGAVPRWLAPWSDWQAADVHVPGQRAHPTRRGATEFQRRAAPLLRETLSGLADGQRPHTMFITCGDSRIVPNLITTSGPGDLFTVRNIGNLVPPAQADPSMNAAVEFAVGVLGVREIVVCGHSGCGAMAALADGPPPGTALEAWLRHAGPSRDRRGPVTLDGERPSREPDRLALHNVLQQLEHLRQYPMVAEAERRGDLVLTGLYFDVGEALVSLSDPGTGAFVAAGTPAVSRDGG
ncbi:SulP family inorganic anion transporter [Amycolatopsis saalfeldensis]|uniref:carbonic anhydrase n=1 Tax=Amycolatopsis saalfeldensis TaxID=394193 RepID=A0A1H8WXC3_9PSEU|nr:bifunctional SulP family inorganic anion transporter/carbonic anhydrase [Amycolatopsis saalfeldensis]SEP32143.1 carbonic anhydrase [Amycolatopsis saalfeldensis]